LLLKPISTISSLPGEHEQKLNGVIAGLMVSIVPKVLKVLKVLKVSKVSTVSMLSTAQLLNEPLIDYGYALLEAPPKGASRRAHCLYCLALTGRRMPAAMRLVSVLVWRPDHFHN